MFMWQKNIKAVYTRATEFSDSKQKIPPTELRVNHVLNKKCDNGWTWNSPCAQQLIPC